MIYKCKVCNSILENLNDTLELEYYGCRNKNAWHKYWFTNFKVNNTKYAAGTTETYYITDPETRIYYELSIDFRYNQSRLTVYQKRTHEPVFIKIDTIIEIPETEEAIIKKLKKISMLA